MSSDAFQRGNERSIWQQKQAYRGPRGGTLRVLECDGEYIIDVDAVWPDWRLLPRGTSWISADGRRCVAEDDGLRTTWTRSADGRVWALDAAPHGERTLAEWRAEAGQSELAALVEAADNDRLRVARDRAEAQAAKLRDELNAAQRRADEAELVRDVARDDATKARAASDAIHGETAHLRQQRDHLQVHNTELTERARAAEAKLKLVETDTEGVWRWLGEGDDPASLSCPVVMSPDRVREFVAAEARSAEWEARARQAEADHDALARIVGQALLVPTLEPGEAFTEPSDHAIVSLVLRQHERLARVVDRAGYVVCRLRFQRDAARVAVNALRSERDVAIAEARRPLGERLREEVAGTLLKLWARWS